MTWQYYQGDDGDWLDANWSSGTKPADDGEAMVPKTVLASINGTDQKGIQVDRLRFADEYAGNIGASGDPLIIDALEVWHEGSGTLYLKSDDNVSTEFTAFVYINSPNMGFAAHLDGKEMTRIAVRSGAVTLASSLGATTLPARVEVMGPTSGTRMAKVTISCALLASTGRLVVSGGQCMGLEAVPILEQTGGIYWHENGGGVITNAYIWGGLCYYNTTGTMVEANIGGGGTLDLAGNRLAKTITTVNLFPGGTLIKDDSLTTITNPINNYGGTILSASDSKMQRAFNAQEA